MIVFEAFLCFIRFTTFLCLIVKRIPECCGKGFGLASATSQLRRMPLRGFAG